MPPAPPYVRRDYYVHRHCHPAPFAKLPDPIYHFVKLPVRAFH